MNILVTLLSALLGLTTSGDFIQTTDGKPFFWTASTAWDLPRALNREDVDTFLDLNSEAGYNVVRILLVDDIPARNAYGALSGSDAYWQHIDYIVAKAAEHGTYVAMAPLFDDLAFSDKIDNELAEDYAHFLAARYKGSENIVWLVDAENGWVTETLANALMDEDPGHMLTEVDHLATTDPESEEEGDPWNAIFEGAAGFTSGADIDLSGNWRAEMKAESFMNPGKLRSFMEQFPYEECQDDQEIFISGSGMVRKSTDFALIYTDAASDIQVNLPHISGAVKKAFRYDPETGEKSPLQTLNGPKGTIKGNPEKSGNDVIVIIDSKSKRFPGLLETNKEALRSNAKEVKNFFNSLKNKGNR